MDILLCLAGILFLLYFICIAFFVSHGTNFYFIWLFLGILSLLFFLFRKKGFWEEYVPPVLHRCFWIVFCAGMIIFLVVEGCIVSGFLQKGVAHADYIIVLGAQMKENGPSKALQYRLDKTAEYLIDNPQTKVIVSGGKGADEPISEAGGMYEYLLKKGVDEEKILQESRSENTAENLKFSAEFLNKEKDCVIVVSNNFHIFRAVKIAQKTGYKNVYGLAAKSEFFLQANNMMREFLGVLKDFAVGNM